MVKALRCKVLSGLGIAAVLISLAGLVRAAPTLQEREGAPGIVSYQGQVHVSDSPFSGTGYFKFVIVNTSGTISYWSNDGTSTDGSEPTESVALAVETGLFNVLLGDTSLGGMTQALTADVFSETDRALRIWFSSDGGAFQLLSPDQLIAAVPYALQAEYAADADTLDGLEGIDYQLSISGSCQAGSTIQTVNTDGTVVCEAHDTYPGFLITTVDTAPYGHVYHASSTIGVDGLPIISYFVTTDKDLMVMHCGNITCSAGNTIATLDSVGDVGQYNSISIGADGLPVISYLDNTNGDLKFTHCGNVACSEGNTIVVLDSTDYVGLHTSITVGVDGLPVIVYSDLTNTSLKTVHCGDSTCSTGNTFANLDSYAGFNGNAITIGSDGMPVISFIDRNSTLKVAHCGNITCSSGNSVSTLDSDGSIQHITDITIGIDGFPVISYYQASGSDLKVVHCGNADCTADNTFTVVDSTGSVGGYPSINIGRDGLPIITYTDMLNFSLKVVHCGDVTCTNNNSFSTVVPLVDVEGTSLTIGIDGLPLIVYYDSTNYDLKVVHCSNEFCLPYWRRR